VVGGRKRLKIRELLMIELVIYSTSLHVLGGLPHGKLSLLIDYLVISY